MYALPLHQVSHGRPDSGHPPLPHVELMSDPRDVTKLLRLSRHDAVAQDRLYALVYDELRNVARNQLRSEREGHTLQPTALANEVYLKMLGQEHVEWQNRAHFFALASRAMRRILVDHARARLREKRGSGAEHVPLDAVTQTPARDPDTDLVALDDVLSRLKEQDPVKCQIVEMRYFVGLTNAEIAEVLGVSSRTVERQWRYAKAWLFRALQDERPGEGDEG